MSEYENSQVEMKPALEERFKDLYEPSLATKRAIDFMAKNPFCDRKVFRTATNVKSFSGAYPEMKYLVGAILDSRTQVRSAYEELQKSTGSNGKKIGNLLYESAQGGTVHQAAHPVEMSFLSNPFALVITVSGEDFQYLRSPDSGGYFMEKLNIYSGNVRLFCPFIAIRRDSTNFVKLALDHERHHAFNSLVEESLQSAEKGNLWGQDNILTTIERAEAYKNIQKLWNQNSTNPARRALLTANTNYKRMISHSLAKIKDEAIVRLTTGEPLDPVTTRYGLYDKIQKHFGMRSQDPLSTFYWEAYTNSLKMEFAAARQSIDTYNKFGLTGRADVLSWMLMRIPLGEWRNELNTVGVTSEVDIIEKIIKAREIQRDKRKGKSEDESRLRDIVTLQEGLLIPRLVEYWQDVERK